MNIKDLLKQKGFHVAPVLDCEFVVYARPLANLPGHYDIKSLDEAVDILEKNYYWDYIRAEPHERMIYAYIYVYGEHEVEL